MLVEEMNLPNSPNPAAPNCPKPSTKPPKAPGVEEFGDSNERRRDGLRGLPMSKTISRQLGPGQPYRAGNRLPDRERDRWYSGVAAEELSNPIASAWKILGGSPMWCTPALTQVPERRWSDVVRQILGLTHGEAVLYPHRKCFRVPRRFEFPMFSPNVRVAAIGLRLRGISEDVVYPSPLFSQANAQQ